jgi:YVTN family beta-propeller protein
MVTVAGVGASAAAAHAATPYALVGDVEASTDVAFNLSTNQTFATFTPGPTYDLAIAPSGADAYGLNKSSNSVFELDLASGSVVATIPVGNGADGLAITPDGRTAYAVNALANSVTPIDLQTNTAEATIPVGSSPDAVAISPDGRTAYVANLNSNTVTPIDVATNTAGTPISAGQGPSALAFSNDGSTLYVADGSGNAVTPIDLATGTTGTPIGINKPTAIAVTPDGSTAWVASFGTGTVAPIDLATGKVGASVHVGQAPQDLAISPDGSTVYVSVVSPNAVIPVSTATGTAGTGISAGNGPSPIAIVQHRVPVTTKVSCKPTSTVIGAGVTCKTKVTDSSSFPSTPTGTVEVGGSTSTAGAGTCQLAGTDGTASCQATYTPQSVSSATHNVVAIYEGDDNHIAGQAGTTVSVAKRPVDLQMSCTDPVPPGQSGSCTVDVNDDRAPGTASAPLGTVRFTTSRQEILFENSCTLSPIDQDDFQSSCSIAFGTESGSAKPYTITATAKITDGVHKGGSTSEVITTS